MRYVIISSFWSIIANGPNDILHHILSLHPKRFPLILPPILRMRKVNIFNSSQRIQLAHMKHLPLYQLELLPAGAREASLVEGSRAGVYEIAREVGISRRDFVAVVSDQKIIPASEGRPVAIETANRLIFQGLGKWILGLVGDREQKCLPPEVSFEVSRGFAKLILPTKRRKSAYNLVILGQADNQGVLVCVTELVKGFCAEIMITSPIQQFKIDLIFEERRNYFKIAYDRTFIGV